MLLNSFAFSFQKLTVLSSLMHLTDYYHSIISFTIILFSFFNSFTPLCFYFFRPPDCGTLCSSNTVLQGISEPSNYWLSLSFTGIYYQYFDSCQAIKKTHNQQCVD